jgi:peptidoglycan/LPS O-acetylase OafA/YrhL
MEFRADINGLRAWAVALVVLYHFGVPGFSGGFVGVDVFFVISGYLMTAIIVGKQAAGQFSVTGFYLSRARRIVPALAVLCLTLLLFGWSWLGALDYRTLGQHALAAIAFISNFVFENEAGYFDAVSYEKWLLHTWSLSVEWQFYLLYPLLLVAVRRVRPGAVPAALWLLAAASLLLSALLTPAAPAKAFFLLPARVWELLAGGLVYLYGDRVPRGPWPARVLETLGLGLILLAGTVLADQARWPGVMALVPVLGTVLVMLAARPDSPATANPVAQAVGRWSYSIYLWHWPLLVGAHYFGLGLDAVATAALVLASVLLGGLSFRYVEEPVRHTGWGRRVGWKAMAAGALLVIVPGAVVSEKAGLPKRLPPEMAQLEAETLAHKKIRQPCGWSPDNGAAPDCRHGAPGAPVSVAVWGDSHAQAAMAAIGEAAGRHGLAARLYNMNSCPPVLGAVRRDPDSGRDCKDFNLRVLDHVLADQAIDTVVFMARWSVYLEGYTESSRDHPLVFFPAAPAADPATRHRLYARGLTDALCRVAAHKRAVVVAPMPEFASHVPRQMARSLIARGRAEAPRVSLDAYRARNRTVLSALAEASDRCGVEIVDPLPYFCDKEACSGANAGLPVYFDDDHLGRHGNRVIAPLFDQLFTRQPRKGNRPT